MSCRFLWPSYMSLLLPCSIMDNSRCMLGSSTHASLVDLMNKPLLFLSYKDTFHTLTRCIIVDTKLSSGSGKTNTYVLLQPFLGLIQSFTWGFLIQTNLKTSPIALPKSWWSWLNLRWTLNQTSLKLWVSLTFLGTTTLLLHKLKRKILHLVSSSTWLPPLRKDKLGDTKV